MKLAAQRVFEALEFIREYGGFDGGHHKQYVLDQIVRILADSEYKMWVLDYEEGEDGPKTYEWEEGVAP